MRALSFRRRGTSLVELLVVIVVFLIGILAVAQIFPGGFKILAGTRARSLATTVARAEVERLKARPDLLPEAILPVRLENTGTIQTIVYEEKSPNDWAPTAAGIDTNGNAVDGTGTVLTRWGQISGANTIRRVVGETHQVGAPRFLSPVADATAGFGGLVTLQFGPMDYDPSAPGTLNVYGRDMYRRTGTVPTTAIDVPREYEYILVDANAPNQVTNPAQIVLPAPVPSTNVMAPLPNDWRFSLSLAVYLNNAGTLVRREVELTDFIQVGPDAAGFSFYNIKDIPGIVPAGQTLVGVERDSVRVARAFRQILMTDAFRDTPILATDPPADPYEYKVVNPFLGTLLFNPAGYNRFEQRPGEARRPFSARVNYNVFDWRILREDFRIPRERFDVNAASTPPSVRLAISPLRAKGDTGADGILAPTMEDNAALAITNRDPAQDHFVLLDLETGGIYHEQYNGRSLIDVNKSSGRVRFRPYNATGQATGWLRLWNGANVEVATANRAVRAFYVTKDEWAVQVLRAPARYTRFVPTAGTPRPVTGTYYLGNSDGTLGGSATRIYFPPADAGRKVMIGRISYVTGGGVRRTYEGGDFVLRYGSGDPIGTLPFLDIIDAASDAVGFDPAVDVPASAVKGASVVVRVFHNDAKFGLGGNSATNLTTGFDRYLRQWRVDTKETFLDGGEPLQ